MERDPDEKYLRKGMDIRDRVFWGLVLVAPFAIWGMYALGIIK